MAEMLQVLNPVKSDLIFNERLTDFSVDIYSCRKAMSEKDIYSVGIANYDIEMEQLYLCLCPNCHHKYESIKMTRKGDYKESIKRAIENISIAEKEPSYKIAASRDMTLYFTQTHLAELQKIFQMLDSYGAPIKGPIIDIIDDGAISDGKLDEIVVIYNKCL